MATSAEVVERVTAEALRQLEEGRAPWHKPWTTTGVLPTSLGTGKVYRGYNYFLLSVLGETMPGPNLWLTYRQAQKMGGHVKKGEKATHIVFWQILKRRDKATGEDVTIPLLKTYAVFHVSQTENVTIPEKYLIEREPVTVNDAVTTVLDGYADGPSVHHMPSEDAYYSPDLDCVVMPTREQFTTEGGYVDTLFHELAHSTGHHSRLNRFPRSGSPARFGGEDYAKEELVAEMAAAMLAGHVGLKADVTRNASYIAGWLRVLKDQPEMLVSAAGMAQRAVDRILGIDPTADAEEA